VPRKTRTTEAKDQRRGIPQGSPISPLLANLYMRRFVLAWKKLGLESSLGTRIVTYADDLVILCPQKTVRRSALSLAGLNRVAAHWEGVASVARCEGTCGPSWNSAIRQSSRQVLFDCLRCSNSAFLGITLVCMVRAPTFDSQLTNRNVVERTTMKTIAIAALITAAAALAGQAAAQTTTDEARAQAAQVTAAYERESLTRPPQPDVVSLGDYRGAAHNAVRFAQWQSRQELVRDYLAGVRSQPIAVNSEDSARAEAQRLTAQSIVADQAAVLRATVAVQ
jgi:hypothetical protein